MRNNIFCQKKQQAKLGHATSILKSENEISIETCNIQQVVSLAMYVYHVPSIS